MGAGDLLNIIIGIGIVTAASFCFALIIGSMARYGETGRR